MKLLSSITFPTVTLLLAAGAQADLMLDLSFADTTTSKSVASGDTVLVDLFLTDTDASTPMASEGLVGGGGRLIQTAGGAVLTESAAPISGTNPAPNWATTVAAAAQPAGTIASALSAAAFPTSVGVGLTTIHIARFTLDVTGAVGDSATVSAATLTGLIAGNRTGLPTFADLDAVLNGGGPGVGFGTVNVTVVPEASTLLVAGLLGCGAFWIRRRKQVINPVRSA